MLGNIFHEQNLYSKGIKIVAGVDEVGRGPLAGPLVACAAVFDLDKLLRINDVESEIYGLYAQVRDSKLIFDKKRRRLNDFLVNELISYSIVEIPNYKIDEIGISMANKTAFELCVEKLHVKPQHLLTDFFPINTFAKERQTNIVRGDRASITIAAASILAKVYRDTLMEKMHYKYPEYGFDGHKGYGTKQHVEVLSKLGPCEIHRKSFEPVKSMLKVC